MQKNFINLNRFKTPIRLICPMGLFAVEVLGFLRLVFGEWNTVLLVLLIGLISFIAGSILNFMVFAFNGGKIPTRSAADSADKMTTGVFPGYIFSMAKGVRLSWLGDCIHFGGFYYSPEIYL